MQALCLHLLRKTLWFGFLSFRTEGIQGEGKGLLVKIPTTELLRPPRNPLLHPLGMAGIPPPPTGLGKGRQMGWGRGGRNQQATSGGLRHRPGHCWRRQGHCLSLAEGQDSQAGGWILPLFELLIFIIYLLY